MSENVKPEVPASFIHLTDKVTHAALVYLLAESDSHRARLTALESKPEAASEPPTPSPRTGEPQDPEGEVVFTEWSYNVYAYKGGKWCWCHEDGTFGEWRDTPRMYCETDLPRAEAERMRPAIKTRFPVSDPYPHWHDAKHGNVARLDSPTSGEFFYASGDRDLVTKYTIAHCHSGHYPRIPYARACELNPHVPEPDQAAAKPVVPTSREELRVGMTFEINEHSRRKLFRDGDRIMYAISPGAPPMERTYNAKEDRFVDRIGLPADGFWGCVGGVLTITHLAPDPEPTPQPHQRPADEVWWVNRYIQCYPPNNGRGIQLTIGGQTFHLPVGDSGDAAAIEAVARSGMKEHMAAYAAHVTAEKDKRIAELEQQCKHASIDGADRRKVLEDRISDLERQLEEATTKLAPSDAKIAELDRLSESLKKEVVGWKKYADSVKQQVRNVIDGVVVQ